MNVPKNCAIFIFVIILSISIIIMLSTIRIQFYIYRHITKNSDVTYRGVELKIFLKREKAKVDSKRKKKSCKKKKTKLYNVNGVGPVGL